MAVLVTAIGVAFLSGRNLIAPDVAATIVVLVAGWSTAHAIDSAGWFNRNLHIIGNIEREFLFSDDARLIHPYFLPAKRHGTMIEHLRIQVLLATAVGAAALIDHAVTRVTPAFDLEADVDVLRCLPYTAALVAVVGICILKHRVAAQHRKLVADAPGAVLFGRCTQRL